MSNAYINTNQAYLAILDLLINCPDFDACPRGIPISELVDHKFTILVPKSSPIETKWDERNDKIAAYTKAEMVLYMAGENKASEWSKIAKLWEEIANPDGTVNSAYGWLIWRNRSCRDLSTPWEWARSSLIKDKDTRQAFLRFSLPEHQWHGNKDQVCTMHMNFLIRDGELRATTIMRSQDVVRGLVYDMPFFIRLQEMMREELLKFHPELKVGVYTHIVHSLHLYEKDRQTAIKMLRGVN